jgi:phage-related protein
VKQQGSSFSRSSRVKEPDDWKPMPIVGSGVQEIRITDKGNAYRVFVLIRFEEAVYVLHVFQKQSQKTANPDLRLAKSRYGDLLRWRKEQGDL